jgi:hypothetical protein
MRRQRQRDARTLDIGRALVDRHDRRALGVTNLHSVSAGLAKRHNAARRPQSSGLALRQFAQIDREMALLRSDRDVLIIQRIDGELRALVQPDPRAAKIKIGGGPRLRPERIA